METFLRIFFSLSMFFRKKRRQRLVCLTHRFSVWNVEKIQLSPEFYTDTQLCFIDLHNCHILYLFNILHSYWHRGFAKGMWRLSHQIPLVCTLHIALTKRKTQFEQLNYKCPTKCKFWLGIAEFSGDAQKRTPFSCTLF